MAKTTLKQKPSSFLSFDQVTIHFQHVPCSSCLSAKRDNIQIESSLNIKIKNRLNRSGISIYTHIIIYRNVEHTVTKENITEYPHITIFIQNKMNS